MSILFVSHNMNYEGAPKLLFGIIKGVRQKFSPVVLSLSPGELEKHYAEINVPVIILPDKKDRVPGQEDFDKYIESICALLKKQDISPELLVYNTADIVWSVVLGKKLCIPTIGILHESVDPFFYYLNTRNPSLYIDLLQDTDCLVFVSEETRKTYNPFLGNTRTLVIHNGIDEDDLFLTDLPREEIRRNLGMEPHDIVIVQIATICHRKGSIYLARAVLEARKKHPKLPIKVIFVGDRRANEDEIYCSTLIEKLAREAGCEKDIKLINVVSDVGYYLKAADIFVLASLNESFPLATLEAMLYRLPVVATSVFGLKEQIIDGKNGFLVRPADSVQLTEKITLLANDPEMRRSLGNAGCLNTKQHFSYKAMTEKYSDLLISFSKNRTGDLTALKK